MRSSDMNGLKWKRYDDSDQPRSGEFALVFFPGASQSCYKIGVRYFIPKKPGYCWGWYPGGQSPHGTFWVPLDEVPVPDGRQDPAITTPPVAQSPLSPVE
jgi:hypothetical protein